MTELVHGFVVCHPRGDYSGIDAEPFEYVESALADGSLGPDLGARYWAAVAACPPPWLPRFVTDLEFARELLALERSHSSGATLLAFHAPTLTSWGHQPTTQSGLAFLGFDVLGLGETSLIRELAEQGHTLGVRPNVYGLLDREADVDAVVDQYETLRDSGRLEGHGVAPDSPIQTVAVYRVGPPNGGTLPSTSTKS